MPRRRSEGRALSAPEALTFVVVVLTTLMTTAYLLTDDVATRTGLNRLSVGLTLSGLACACALARARHVWSARTLLAGMVLLAVGEVVAAGQRVAGVAPYPNDGEAWAAAGALLLLLGSALLVGRRGRVSAHERLDMGIGAVSLLLFVAVSGLVTYLGSGTGQLVAGTFLVAAVAPVVVGVLVVSRPETSRAGMWLVVAAVSLISADAGFVVGTSGGVDAEGRITDVGYVVSRGALVVMALSLAGGQVPSEHEVGRRRVLVAGTFALLVPVGFLVGADTGVQNPVWLTVLGCSVPVVLLTWRAVRSVDELALVAAHDGLTGLANRRAFDHRLDATCGSGEDAVLLVADLDGFKRVNDRNGHVAGDRVLVAVADGLRRAAPGAFIARLGGDEFAVLLPGTVEPGPARGAVLDTLAPVLATWPGLGISVGAARSRPGVTPDQLLVEADAAMYSVKQSRGASSTSDAAVVRTGA